MASHKEQLQCLNGFLAKADGKDKLTALIQYACMFLSAGQPGNIKKIQASVTAARKVFRVLRPLESMVPVLLQPGLTGKQHPAVETINKLKSVLMALYFGADHVVWAHQIGLSSNKALGERAQKVSLYSWALGSVCTVVVETWQLLDVAAKRAPGEGVSAYLKRQEAARKEVNTRLFTLVHALFQAALAAGLLQLLPWKPRTVGALGVIASAMNCYQLCPPLPAAAPAVAPVAARREEKAVAGKSA